MESLTQVITQMGGSLWLEGDQIRFRLPKSDQSGAILDQLRQRKPDIVAQLRRAQLPQEQSGREKLGLGATQAEERFFPMRVEQVWLTELRKNGIAPTIPFDGNYLRPLPNGLNLDGLERLLYDIVQNNDALHSLLLPKEGRPTQKLIGMQHFAMERMKLNGNVLGDPGTAAAAIKLHDRPPLDLLKEAGFQCRAFSDAEGNSYLQTYLHHYFSDGWSIELLGRELDDGIHALHLGEHLAARKPRKQFHDYAREQRYDLMPAFSETLAYWQRTLDKVPPATLPHTHRIATDEMGSIFFTWSSDLAFLLEKFSGASRTSLSTLLLAAYQIAIARWSNQKDIVNAVSIADRFRPEYSDTFGYLIVALPVRSDLSKHRSLSEFIEYVGYAVSSAYAYRALSYELFDEVMNPPQPFCPSLFNFVPANLSEEVGLSRHESAGIDGQPITQGVTFLRQMHHRELYVQILEQPQGGLRGKIYYNKDYFTLAAAKTFVAHYEAVLRMMITAPQAQLSDFF